MWIDYKKDTFKSNGVGRILLFSISNYASVSTQTSILIIGGWSDGSLTSSIVEYKDDKWTVIGNLKQARYGHQAISIGSLVMIIGGYSSDQA